MDNFSWITCITIFVTYVVIDMLYAAYIIYVNERKPIKSATVSCVIYSLLAYGVISYSENVYYLIPLATGAWLGTYITVKLKK